MTSRAKTPTNQTAPAEQPESMLRVISGHPTEEELAAIVFALSAVGGLSVDGGRPTSAPATPSRSGWSAYWRTVQQLLPDRGPDAWRQSARS